MSRELKHQATALGAMADLTIQHKTAKILILRLREGLEQLERAEQVG